MASTYTTPAGSLMVIPDSAVNVVVQNQPAGQIQSGVVAIIGEADAGPSWSQDLANGIKLSMNAYGPTDLQAVVQKYTSGQIVDAFRGVATPSSSPRIQGGPNSIIVVKVNSSTPATLPTPDGHGTFQAKSAGAGGNSIQVQVTDSQSEDAPTTGAFTYVPNASGMSMQVRVNGGAAEVLPISANTSPTVLATAITTNLAGVSATGGVNRNITSGLTNANSVSLSGISGQTAVITLATPAVWGNTPVTGDVLQIPSGSVIAGGSSQNVGYYLVTAVSNTTSSAAINVTKVTAGAPSPVTSTPFSATPANDVSDYSPLTISNVTGTNRNVITAALIGQTLTATAAGSQLTISLPAADEFGGLPSVGDSLYIPSTSVIAGAGSANVGYYTVTSVSNTSAQSQIIASRLSNGTPVTATAAIVATTDLTDLNPQILGVGKAMEIEDNAGAANIDTSFFNLGTTTAASFLDELEDSSAEREIQISVKNSSTGANQNYTGVGGNVTLSLGYDGTTGTATIAEVGTNLMLTTTVTGGIGSNLSINLSLLPNINDLVTQLNAQPGYSASVSSALYGSLPTSVLDQVTAMGIASDLGNRPGRIKQDIYDLNGANNSPSMASSLVSYVNTKDAGLPSDMTFTFLSGGQRGASSGLTWANAINACQGIMTNFIVPLVSQNASLDITAGVTDPGSTYTVAGINAAILSHVLAMSTETVKRNRIGVVSNLGTFAAAEQAAANLSNFRMAMLFQNVYDLNSQGDIASFQPWYGAVKAAGMQAAGGYKPMFNKTVNLSSAYQAAGDFDDGNVTDVEQAILAGLIPIVAQPNGGYTFATDQMTYGLDNNIVYNSMQAVYVSDLMALSLASSLKSAFVGESVADVTVSTAESFIKAIMSGFLFAKYTVATPSAPGGWSSINVNINGNVLLVTVTAVIATGIKFIPITLSIEGINTSASANGSGQ